jgi:predicted SprT family Zn-dependent metalloprotease|tara:strand:- start:496 stop:786 length:291 start_codon:yes stop_codon:yes gene_type:complete
MNKKEIQELSKYLVEKTKGQFHYEEDYWKEFFSNSEVEKLEKKINVCMEDQNYEYFCDCIEKASNNLKIDWKNISPKELKIIQSSATFKIFNKYCN